ncbi:MAG: hypothetical protein KDD48_02695, partial [Bdellovibrionales bacterium]|nr:hypothetical protein [Bdellovibrionales bacterium]
DSMSYTYRQKEVIPMQIGLHAPLGHRTLKEYVKRLKQSEMSMPPYETVVQQLDLDLIQKNSKPQFVYHVNTNAQRMLTFIPELMGTFVPKQLSESWDDARQFKPDQVMKIILGEEGLTYTTYTVPFVRPKSQKEFKIKEISTTPEIRKISDRLNREWTLMNWKILDQTLEVYCLPTPQGFLCVNRASFLRDPHVLEISQRNFVDYFLSEYFVHTPFWRLDAFRDYLQKVPNVSPVWSDVDMEWQTRNLKITLKTLGVSIEVPATKSDMFRIVGGMTKLLNQEQPIWMAFGVDHIVKTGGKLKWCTVAMEPPDQPEHPSMKELQKTAKTEKAIKAAKFSFKQGGYDIKTWSYCNPIEIKAKNKTVLPKYTTVLPYAANLKFP